MGLWLGSLEKGLTASVIGMAGVDETLKWV